MFRPAKLCPTVLVACAALAASATLASAQTLRVRLVDGETRQPLAGVLVSALSATGAVGAPVLSLGDGIASVRTTGSGPYRLLIRRIGFAPVTTDPITTPAESAQAVEVMVPAHRVTLGTVHVVGNQSCAEQTESPSAGAQQAWSDVRTALEASTLTRDQRLVTTAALRFQRELRQDLTVDFADTTLRGRSGERPFFAPAPAVLERDGYFKHHDDGSEEFFAPDEYVLLSPGFTRLHCVTVFPDTRHDSTGTQVALAFVPRDRATRPEIRGLIWIDSATSELRRIEYEYVRVALRAPADSLGGHVEFRHLASGAWIVSAWALRIPRFREIDRGTGYAVLEGYLEVGGTAAVVRDVATPGPNVPRSIVGSVYDSLMQRPLSGAHVHLADLGREAVADSLGGFRFDSVGAGTHTVWADHPTLDELGLFSLGAGVDAELAAVRSVTLAIPSFATLWHRACGAGAVPETGAGFVFGRVLPGATPPGAAGAAGAAVTVRWPPATGASVAASTGPANAVAQRTAQTDSTGSYAVCGVPSEQTVSLSAGRGDTATTPVWFRVGPARIARRDITLPSAAEIDQIVADTSAVAPVLVNDGATLAGIVRDSSGAPVHDARVTVSGVAREWKTGADGGFVVRGIPAGTRVVAVGGAGYVAQRRLVGLATADSAYVALSLARAGSGADSRTLRVVSADGQPVVYANVSIEGGITQITDEKGEVALGRGNLQGLTLRVRRIGYAPWFGKVDFRGASPVLTVTLARVGQQLGAVQVTGRKNPSSPFVQGFYDRWLMRQKGVLSAVFIGPEELEFRHPDKITNMLAGLNGVSIQRITMGGVQFNYLVSTMTRCKMAIMIDGKQQYPEVLPGSRPPVSLVLIDLVLPANDVMGIEVYARGGNMPISLQADDSLCGVVAFWTGARR